MDARAARLLVPALAAAPAVRRAAARLACCQQASVQLLGAIAVTSTHLHRQRLRLVVEVPLLLRALRNRTELLLVVRVRVHGEAPGGFHARVGIPAIVVVPEAIAPLRRLTLLAVWGRTHCSGFRPRVVRGPLLACAATDGGGRQAAIAPPLRAPKLDAGGILLVVAVEVERRHGPGAMHKAAEA